MKDACAMIDDVEQLMFRNTSLINLMQGFCIQTQEDIQEMEYLVEGLDLLIENQKTLQNKIEAISDKVYKTAYNNIYNSISPCR